jgi:hypothetical protein
VRIYLPATTSMLRELHASGQLADAPLTAFAVTPGLREWYRDDDLEALEYAAMTEAGRGSLRLLDADLDAARRRVVLAADMPDDAVQVRDDLDRGVVSVTEPVPISAVASVHIDDPEAAPTVAAAADAVIAADLGDATSQERVDDAEGFELGWYATQEIGPLLDSL